MKKTGMTATGTFPITATERAELGSGLVSFPATFDEFWQLLAAAEYRLEYQNGEIITMSYETDPHSILVSEMLRLLGNIFEDKRFAVHNPNRPIYIKTDDEGVVFNPDASVVLQPSELFEYQPGMTAVRNPILVVEVLSPNTRGRDFSKKLPAYKLIPSLRQIIYIEQEYPMVYLYERNAAGKWQATLLEELESSLEIGGQRLDLRAIYRRLL